MYFDAILDVHALPLFNGTTGECLKWLEEHPDEWDEHCTAVIGCMPAVVSVPEYLEMFGGSNYQESHRLPTTDDVAVVDDGVQTIDGGTSRTGETPGTSTTGSTEPST